MKSFLAVITAIAIFLFGWLILVATMAVIALVGTLAREQVGLIHYIHQFLTWVLGPSFGSFLATSITPKFFKSIDSSILVSNFITVIITVSLIFILIKVVRWHQSPLSVGGVVIFITQVMGTVIGAKLGRIYFLSTFMNSN